MTVLLAGRSLVLAIAFSTLISSCHAFSPPQGTAAAPLDKKKIAVIGAGGYLGAITFGFLQRAGSLYGTGIDRSCRCISATSVTSISLNGILGKHFVLAQADESFIKLTDLQSTEAIRRRLEGCDAIIVGNSMVAETRPVTPGTFDRGPNDKTVEVYWDTVRGKDMESQQEDDDPDDAQAKVQLILDNALGACKHAGTIQHVVAVATATADDANANFRAKVRSCGVPHTFIQCRPGTLLTKCPDYTYRKGVQTNLLVSQILSSSSSSESNSDDDAAPSSSSNNNNTIGREDLAALCVQCLQSLDWKQSRSLLVQSDGPLTLTEPSSKRPDQEWCVNSHVLANTLSSIL